MNNDQTLVNTLHGLIIVGLDYRVITTEYRTRVHCILYFVMHWSM